MDSNATLEDALSVTIDDLLGCPTQSSRRLDALADYCVERLAAHGVPGARGGTAGEEKVAGFGRTKTWDVAFLFAGKPRLLVSLKSILRNMSGTVPNRIDDLIGEVANVQHQFPEVVIGYVVVLDQAANSDRGVDRSRNDDTWIDYFIRRVQALAVRQAPVWSAGLIEACWFVRIDSAQPTGKRLVDPPGAVSAGEAFFERLSAMMRSTVAPG